MYAYGKALGQLHILSAEYSPKIRKWTYRDVLLWIGKTLEKYRAPNKKLVELEKVQQALDVLPKTNDSFGLVHYDFEPDNVFWDEARQCCTVIDFEDGMYHFFLLDLEQALDALLESIPADRQIIAKLIRCIGEEYPNELDWMVKLREKLHRKIIFLENSVMG